MFLMLTFYLFDRIQLLDSISSLKKKKKEKKGKKEKNVIFTVRL